jgi:xanthine dehydrogenase accessory factor
VNDSLRAAALHWLDAGRAAAVVEVVSFRGSVPRETGTRMLVAADETLGTIGGGHLELQAIRQARALLESGGPSAAAPLEQHVALGPSLGQCCGGSLDLRFTMLAQADPAAWPAPRSLFFLQLYGAGHVGRAVARLLADIPCQVQWIDERESEFPADPSPPHIQRLCTEPVQAEVAAAPANAYYLVLTHSHELDLALALAILRRGDAGFFGLIGSRTKRRRFVHRLAERGVGAQALTGMVCPIGIAGIAGKEPGIIAVAAVAQLLLRAGP